MIEHRLDYSKPYRVVVYLRMSSDKQNPRSPEQQLTEIKRRLKALKLNWKIVAVYRDEAISGRLTQKRKDFSRMLSDIRSQKIQVDLILVDTAERFGRSDQMVEKRRELHYKHGVLVLTADSNFSDPNTPQGRALAMVDQFRSTEDGRVKAHHVNRGKRDAVSQKKWPGGAPPLGYRLQPVVRPERGRDVIEYSTLVFDAETKGIVQRIFQLADEKAWGQVRIARALNADPAVPGILKPFSDALVGYVLKNEIYCGVLVWGKYSSDVFDDTHVRKANNSSEIERVEGFCEPLVDPQVWARVNEQRSRRGELMWAARRLAKNADKKLIAPPCPGLTLVYPLTGLLRCAHCGRSMRPQSSKYKPNGELKAQYLSYFCPGSLGDQCVNRRRVDGHWLWQVVADTIRARLLSTSSDWLPELKQRVSEELRRLQDVRRPDQDGLIREKSDLQLTIDGLGRSLAKPDLADLVRTDIETRQYEALKRRQDIDNLLELEGQHQTNLDALLDMNRVAQKLDQLAKVLASDNPTRLNLELSLHIDRIDCFSDGHVEQRTCLLGGLADVREALSATSENSAGLSATERACSQKVQFRMRPKLRVFSDGLPNAELNAATHVAADPNRFAGLGEEWFWIDRFEKPVVLSWPREHAAEVLKMRLETGWSFVKLGKHFGKSKHTMRAAVKIALQAGELPDLDGEAVDEI